MPNGVYNKICSFSSDETAIMSLEFDVSTGYLRATCDNHCSGRSNVLSISNTSGTFTHIAKVISIDEITSFCVRLIINLCDYDSFLAQYDRPSAMGNYNTEGFAIAPADKYCGTSAYSLSSPTTTKITSTGRALKAVFWADDDCTNGHALRQGTIYCGEFI